MSTEENSPKEAALLQEIAELKADMEALKKSCRAWLDKLVRENNAEHQKRMAELDARAAELEQKNKAKNEELEALRAKIIERNALVTELRTRLKSRNAGRVEGVRKKDGDKAAAKAAKRLVKESAGVMQDKE